MPYRLPLGGFGYWQSDSRVRFCRAVSATEMNDNHGDGQTSKGQKQWMENLVNCIVVCVMIDEATTIIVRKHGRTSISLKSALNCCVDYRPITTLSLARRLVQNYRLHNLHN